MNNGSNIQTVTKKKPLGFPIKFSMKLSQLIMFHFQKRSFSILKQLGNTLAKTLKLLVTITMARYKCVDSTSNKYK